MPKPSAFLLKMQREYEEKLLALRLEYEAKFQIERHCARVFQMDMVTIAMGRLGWGEKRLKKLDEALLEVAKDMGASAKEEMKYDPELWVTCAKHEDELKKYAGSLYREPKERYFG
jgi:hypothetical protein